jgi:hypothetical protein
MKRILTMYISTVIAGKSFAQQPSTSNWVTLQTPVIYNSHWQSLHEASYRTLGEAFKLNQLFLRGGIRYTFNPKWSTSIICDIVHARVKPYDKNDLEFGDEIRLTEEINYRSPVGKTYTLLHRLRIEERFFGETSLGHDYKALRFRYRLGALKKLSSKWDIQLANEYLRQLLDGDFKFSSNRLSFSCYFRFAANAHIEATYYWIKFPLQSQHVFSVAFQNRIIVKHKKKSNAS